MQVTLEAIKFNHDPASATNDAFNIRKNETEPVVVPEWSKGVSIRAEDSRAAYAISSIHCNAVTIQAQFKHCDQSVSTIMVQAIAPGCGNPNILGQICPTPVTLVNGDSGFVTLTLCATDLVSGGVGVTDIQWCWQYSTEPDQWIEFAQTAHRIYTVLELPNCPWQPDSCDNTNSQQPWTEVLEVACRWAASAQTLPQAATLITEQVNALGGNGQGSGLIQFDEANGGSTAFTLDSPPSFDCADFLLLIGGQPNDQGNHVNCDDCAAFVTSFANILGCKLAEASMDGNFLLNPHLRIGEHNLQTDSFSYHTVAWAGQCREDDEVFDACVQLEQNPGDATSLFVPADIRFGFLNEELYRFLLTSTPSQCLPINTPPLCRRIGFSTLLVENSNTNQARIKHVEQKVEKDIPTAFVKLLSSFSSEEMFLPWRVKKLAVIEDRDSLIYTQSFWRNQNVDNVALRIDAYAVESNVAARAKLRSLLKRFQLRLIKREEHPEFGDIVYSVPEKFAILFARESFVFRLRNVGLAPISCEDIARRIDAILTRYSDLKDG